MNDSDIITFVRPYTSVSIERIQNVLTLVEEVVRNKIPGDLAEVGVWKGGLLMAMALKCNQLGEMRTIHAYDTFSGMTEPTDMDVDLDGYKASDIFHSVKCEVGFREVQENVSRINYPNIQYHRGDITKADPTSFPTFALLRLDTDWYESTKFELTHMEPRVSPYGFVIVDDYGHWRGSKRAVEEHNPPDIHPIDYTGIWWQKDFGRGKLEDVVRTNPDSDMARALLDNFHHFIALGPDFHHGCGSYLISGQSYAYQPETFKKQQALFTVGKQSSHVLEIGVYLGHSLLLLLLSNPSLRITCVDVDAKFSPAAVKYLNEHFGNRIQFHLADSKNGLPAGVYDCVHIDADHQVGPVTREFGFAKPLATPNAWFVFDDYEALRSLIDGWIQSGVLVHVETPWCLWTNVITRLNNVSS